jgi:ferrous iron transport protein B
MRPVGFDWKTSTALLGAFAAKEVFVAQLGIVHSLGEADEQSEPLRAVLQREYTPLQAFCIMLFCLISIPCMATVAITWQESGSWKWAALQLAGLTVLAYLVTLVVYQAGSFLSIGVA